MPVEYVILKSAAFLMENGFFAGSGFFVFIEEDEYAFAYFVTAAHVVWKGRRNATFPPDGEVSLKMNLFRGGGTKEISLKKSEWNFHEDRFVDLCAVCLDDHKYKIQTECDVSFMNIAALAASNYNQHIPAVAMMLGDEVFITGAFGNRLGEKKNIPIVRTGNIAALCEEPVERFSPRQAAYLIETRSLNGISGSPVFFNPHTRYGRWRSATGQIIDTNSKPRESSEPTVIVPYRFVGMVLGTWSSNVAMDFLPDDDSEKNRDSDWNTGISVVIPDFRIMEFLMSPALKQQRLQSVEEREKRSGVRLTSARRHEEKIQATGDEAESQTHLEDFSRLVDVAARKRKQDDQS